MSSEDDAHQALVPSRTGDEEPKTPEAAPQANPEDLYSLNGEGKGKEPESTAALADLTDVMKTKLKNVVSIGKEGAKGTARKTLKFSVRFLQGGWLPLFQDKLRNNSRNRPMMILVYVLLSLFVAGVLLYTNYTPEVNTRNFAFTVPPDPTFYFGVPANPIIVQYTDSYGNGIADTELFLSFTLLSDVDVNVTLPNNDNGAKGTASGFSNSVSCVDQVFLNENFEATILEYEAVCNLVQSRYTAITNKMGIANFSNVVFPYGWPGQYLVVVALPDQSFRYITAFVEVEASVISVEADPEFSWREVAQRAGTLRWDMDEHYPFSATALVRSPIKPSTVMGAVIPLNMASKVAFATIPSLVPYTTPEDQGGEPRVIVQNSLTAATSIEPHPTLDDVYVVTFNVSNFTVIGSNTNRMFLGFTVWGTTTPMITSPLTSEYQFPNQLLFPLELGTPVARVTVMNSSSWTASEGQDLHFVVKVEDVDGKPLANRFVFGRTYPSVRNPGLSQSEASMHPGVSTKQLLYSWTSTDAGGIAVLRNMRYTVSGAPGMFETRIVVDGVAGNWTGEGGTEPPVRRSRGLVTSIIDKNESYVADSRRQTAVAVGTEWISVPEVRLVGLPSTGGLPLPGKSAALVSRDITAVGISSKAIPSDDEGIVRFGSVVVPYAIAEGTYTFDVVVDNITIGNVSRHVTYANPEGHALDGKCAFTPVYEMPPFMYNGVHARFVFKTVDWKGRPVPNAKILGILPSDLVPPGPGQNISFTIYITNSNGVFDVPAMNLGMSRTFVMLVQLMCYDSAFSQHLVTNLLAEPYAPRAHGIRLLSSSATAANESTVNNITSTVTLEVDADWDLVSAANPMNITAAASWAPQSMRLVRSTLVIEPVSVTGPGPIVLRANYSSPENRVLMGLYCFFISVDETKLLPPLMMGLPILVQNVQLIRSANFSLASIGDVLPQSPILRLTWNGKPMLGRQVIAQLGVVNDTNTSAIRWLSPWRNSLDIGEGVLGIDRSPFAVSRSVSDDNGQLTVDNLAVVAARGPITLALRYCAVLDVVDPNHLFLHPNSPESVCVEEPGHLQISEFSATRAVATPLQLFGVPGKPLPPATITSFQGDGRPSKLSVCYLRQITPPPVRVSVRTEFGLTSPGNSRVMISSGGVLFTNTSEIDLTNLIEFDAMTPAGEYVIAFVCGGATTAPIFITVSTKLSALVQLSRPPSELIVERFMSLQVMAQGSAAIPLVNRHFELSITPDQSCEYNGCGVISPLSTMYSQTARDGIVTFDLAFSAAATGKYNITVREAPAISSTSIRQRLNSVLSTLKRFMGVPLYALGPRIGALGGSNLETQLRVVSVLASTTVVENGQDGQNSGNSIQRYAESIAGSAIKKATARFFKPVTTSLVTTLVNNITVMILRQPTFTGRVNSVAILNDISGIPVIEVDKNGPKILVLDENGEPYPNAPVTVEVVPSGPVTAKLDYPFTSALGELDFDISGLELKATSPGSFRFRISVKGGGANVTEPFHLQWGQVLTLSDSLQYLSFVIIFIFSPMSMALVPHSRGQYLAFSVFATSLTVAAAAYFLDTLSFADKRRNTILTGYLWLLLGVSGIMALICWVMAFCSILGKYFKLFRFVNDEGRAAKIVRYSDWLLHVDVDTQLRPAEKTSWVTTAMATAKSWFKSKKNSQFEYLNEKLDERFFTTSTKTIGRKKRVEISRSLWYDPKVDDCCNVPLNFWIAVSLAAVLLLLASYFMYYLFVLATNEILKIMRYLPDPAGTTTQNVQKADEAFGKALTMGISTLTSTVPQLAFLGSWVEPLAHIDIVTSLIRLREFLAELIVKMNVSLVVGLSVAGLTTLVALVTMAYGLPAKVREIRRGTVQSIAPVVPSEPYIGLHAMIVVLTHQLLFWPVMLVTCLLMIEEVRVFLWNKLSVLLVATVISIITQKSIQVFFVGWFLSRGFFVVRPEMYSIWHFAALVLGVFTGVAKSISRWVLSLVLATLLFARVDLSIYPQTFAFMDLATAGLNSIVTAEAKNGNPHSLVFAAWIILERSLRDLTSSVVKDDTAVPKEVLSQLTDKELESVDVDESRGTATLRKGSQPLFIDCNTFYLSRSITLSNGGLRNIIDLLLSRLASGSRYLLLRDFTEEVRVVRERVRQRFWLLFLLHKNPSLRKLRKHYLYVTAQELLTEAEVEDDMQWDEAGEEDSVALEPVRTAE